MGTYGGGQKRENNGFSKISEFAFFSEFQMRGSDGRIGFVNAKRKTKFGCPNAVKPILSSPLKK